MTSVSPYLCGKITNGQCKMLVRKSAPKEVPFKAYIYCTKTKNKWMLSDYEGAYQNSVGEIVYAQQHVIGEFICDKVEVLFNTNGNPENYMTDILPTVLQKTALSFKEFQDYVGSRSDKNNIYGWHISDLKIYDKPKELSEFGRKCDYASEIHCRDCLFLGDWDSCCGVMCKPLTRPPQSYMFVEEV
jgi:predicted transcriptional regulator